MFLVPTSVDDRFACAVRRVIDDEALQSDWELIKSFGEMAVLWIKWIYEENNSNWTEAEEDWWREQLRLPPVMCEPEPSHQRAGRPI